VSGYGLPSVSALKQAIHTYGPVTAGVCVGSAFTSYTGGVFQTNESGKCPYGTNHAVMLVGWDDGDGVWYLRNSWGAGWGEHGTMRIRYGLSQVGEDASYIVYGQAPANPVEPQPGGPSALSTKLFLPVIANASGGQAPPPNPAPAVPSNGGFESGSDGWIQSSRYGWQLILGAADLPVAPHGGTWAVWLGGDYDEVSFISQQVTVPIASPFLTYWYWISSSSSCGADTGGVVVNGTVIQSYDLCAARNTQGWAKGVVDLSAYTGQLISLQMRAETNSSSTSDLYVDDVWFESSLTTESDQPPTGAIDEALPKSSRPTHREPSSGATSTQAEGRLF
jgi:hypothetical protein